MPVSTVIFIKMQLPNVVVSMSLYEEKDKNDEMIIICINVDNLFLRSWWRAFWRI